MKLFRFFTEFITWLGIVLSPTLITGVASGLIYLKYRTVLSIWIAFAVTLVGFLIGVFWAKRIKKKMDYVTFSSKIMATPELDEKEVE